MDEGIFMKLFSGRRGFDFVKTYDLLNLEPPILKELFHAIRSCIGSYFVGDENFILNPKEYYYDKYELRNCLKEMLFMRMFAVEDVIYYKEILAMK